MPLPPPDPAPASRAANPARILLDSPLAAATRGRVYQQRARSQPHERGRRVLAMAGALLVHLLFLFGFVLGPAFEPTLPPPPPELALQIRLIEPAEPPPPPPQVRGTPPKEHGPRHQGRHSTATPRAEPSANVEAAVANAPPPVPAPTAIAQAAPARAPTPKPVATPPPPVSLPAPAPLPLPKPAPAAGEPPALAIQLPTPVAPAPPKFQPEPVSPPQLEGNRPVLSPTSLALPKVSTPPAPLNVPAMAMHVDMPKTVAPISVTPAPQPPASPEVPRLQPLPLPTQPSPIVMQQGPALAPVAIAPKPLPQPQAPAITVGAVQFQVAPVEPAPAPAPAAPMPPATIDLTQSVRAPAIQPSALRPSVSAPTTVANVVTPTPTPTTASEPKPASTPASAEAAAPTPSSAADTTSDVSRAPDAIPQGRDDATVGEPASTDNAPPTTASTSPGTSPVAPGAGKSTDTRGKLEGAGKVGGNQPGAREGEQHGSLGDYVQLKPRGDTEIMRHGAPNIGYQPTRFDENWTPEGESSIDTALRHAVEKTTVKHIFHLPRGVRVECAIRPLLPVALFGCTNPDPPAVPLPAKIYERLNMAPAQPLAPPAPAASTPAPPARTPMIKFDNSAECAAARVAGGPLPPGCEIDSIPATQIRVPASSSSSWVPASDQFH
ncbi:MAG: hypothetical protein ABI386_05535 [Rhodanobacter sp.]